MTQDGLSSVGFDVHMSDLDRRQPLGVANPDSSGYVHIAENFCPYIGPAIETQAFFQSHTRWRRCAGCLSMAAPPKAYSTLGSFIPNGCGSGVRGPIRKLVN